MSKGLKVLGIALILTVAVSMLAADTTQPRAGKSSDITFTSATKVGDALLPAGNYKVQQVTDGDTHLLVFRSDGNKEKARVACKLEALTSKAGETQHISTTNDAGERLLRSVEFKGEKVRHELVDQSTASAH